MSLEYSAVQWNRQKRIYDFVLAGGVGAFLILFGVLSKVLFPFVTDEIMLMRAFAAASFLLLHVILCVGPLCRLNRNFLPLLYNRRHAGVTMCLLGLIHAALVVITYHAGGDTNPILSIFKGSPLTGSIAGVPFQPFGFVALMILLLMAALQACSATRAGSLIRDVQVNPAGAAWRIPPAWAGGRIRSPPGAGGQASPPAPGRRGSRGKCCASSGGGG
jgi:hypothetical protein